MNNSLLLQRAAIAATALLAFSPANAQNNDTSPASDPWFDKPLERAQSDDKDDDAKVTLSAKNPRALFRELKKTYDQQAEGNLSKRIGLLEEMLAVAPDQASSLNSELDRLKQTRAAAQAAIDAASASSTSLSDSLQQLQDYARYIAFDPSLLIHLLESPLSRRIESTIRASANAGDLEALAAIDAALARPPLDRSFGSRYQSAIQRGYASVIETRWADAASHAKLLPGEQFLVGKLLQSPDAKLALALRYAGDTEPRIRENIRRSLERRFGDDLLVSTETARDPDLFVAIESGPIQQEVVKSEELKDSTIPGRVTETANPEFVALVKKYEKAAKNYEAALDAYDASYRNWIDQMDDTSYNQAQRDLNDAKEIVNATPPTLNNGQDNPDYAQAVSSLQIAQAVANSVEPVTMPEPVKPYPSHLKILDDLYLIPATIVTSSESEPYQYTKRTLKYRFHSEASLSVSDASQQGLEQPERVELSQERTWTQNVNVSPKDPAVDDGDFSQKELESTLDIFALEFGSDCAKAFSKTAAQAADRALKSGIAARQLDQILLGLALQYSISHGDNESLALDEQHLKELASLAQKSDDPALEFRKRCLKIILTHPAFSSYRIPDDLVDQYFAASKSES